MANFSFITSSAVTGQDSSIEYQPTTATPFVTPTWGSVVRAQQSTDAIQVNHTPTGLGSAEQGWLTGRRPAFNLKFPRGYYNK
tara:strand:+ start:1460 stop:1708 length:249 start_codon:yes stop_codon:yes gene_type:complete